MQLQRPLVLTVLAALALFSAAALGAGTASLLYLKEIAAIQPTSFATSAALHAARATPDRGPLPTPGADTLDEADEADALSGEDAGALLELGDTGEAADEDATSGPRIGRSPLGSLLRERRRPRSQSSSDTTPQATPQAASQQSTCADKIDGVTRHSATKFTLSRAFVRTYIEDQDKAAQQGRAAWRQNKSQDNVGVRVSSLRCAPRTAGLRNNDVIKEVNGRPMTSTVSAYAAYRDIKGGDRFSVKLKRDNQLMTIQYTVR